MAEEVILEEAPSINLKDRDYVDHTLEGVSALRVPTADGGYQDFVAGEVVEKTIAPDFSAGDIEVEADAGEFISKVTVQKPENLLPENIVEGVDIAGIIGTLAAGGGAKIATGTFTGRGAQETVHHGLGVIPDVVIVKTLIGSVTGCMWSAVGFSSNFINLTGIGFSMFYVQMGGTSNQMNTTVSIDKATTSGGLMGANEDTILVGCTNNIYPENGRSYMWLAIGGLT